jgi:hypothetical protein
MVKVQICIIFAYSYLFSQINFNTYNYIPEDFRVMCPTEFNLQGAQESSPLFISIGLPTIWGNIDGNILLEFKKLFVIYSEETDGSDSIQIRVGIPSDNYYYHVLYTGKNRTRWDVDTIPSSAFTASKYVYNNGQQNVLLVTCMGGKVGTGKVYVGAEFTRKKDF